MKDKKYFIIVQIVEPNGNWTVVGPYRVKMWARDVVVLSNDVKIERKYLYCTKGGATKRCYRLNYERKGKS